jgi:nucleotide-binding universal stress UspA family protein
MSVLASIDLSDHSDDVLACATRIAELYRTDLHVLHCRAGPRDSWRPSPWSARGQYPGRAEERRELEQFLDQRLGDRFAPQRLTCRLEPPPISDAIETIAESEKLDTVVVGASHRGSLAKLLLETTPEGVVRESDVPVVVVPSQFDDKRLDAPLVTLVDPEQTHRKSIESAADLARRAERPLRLLDTRNEPADNGNGRAAPSEDGYQRRRREVEQFLLTFDLRGIDYEIVPRPGSPVGALLAEVESDRSGLVVLGREETTPIQQLIFGNTTFQMLRRLPAPVLVVPEHDEVAGIGLPAYGRALA